MAVLAHEVDWKRVLKFLSAAFAALLALPALMRAQAQRMNADWLILTPIDPKASLPESKANVTSDEAGTTVSIDRRTRYRSRQDSVAGTLAYEASKRDENLRIVVSLEDKKL